MSHTIQHTDAIATACRGIAMQISNHALTQMKQRAITGSTIHYLIEWGRKAYDHKGAVIRYFDKTRRIQLRKHVGASHVKQLENQLNAYVVVSTSGQIITVGHRYKRILRN
ncbi:hypothetical protein [Craterilacuibacter sinensis]|uniref:DUF4258 domain-containing protein n=1 Tax=Craterilacuibacter sinensis TaxID=2686017 RepID=A0A845BUA3_9NEIS|nr:hypothetical protein [Craterilacuibacter sinensis]MXR36113.1 hypothetical protein [Craterilacuibacter sinensis]